MNQQAQNALSTTLNTSSFFSKTTELIIRAPGGDAFVLSRYSKKHGDVTELLGPIAESR